MTLFRPCIDLHQGKVKQIVGGTYSDTGKNLATNFITDRKAAWFAELYQKHGLKGGHIIKLGPGNDKTAKEALEAYPGGLQIGGGINIDNARRYLKLGASHVIVTSWLIPENEINWARLQYLTEVIGRERLVLDLSCRRRNNGWYIAKDQWQTVTKEKISMSLLERLQEYCDEFLIHAADVEGRRQGIDKELVTFLGKLDNIPVTYAGGASSIDDLRLVENLSHGKVDLSIGSALDIFGGAVKYEDCVKFNISRSGGTGAIQSRSGAGARA